MSKVAKKQRAIFIVVFAALLATLILFWQHISQEIVSGGPHIQLVIGEDRGRNTLPNGHYVGANFIYHRDNGTHQHENIPSLQGLW